MNALFERFAKCGRVREAKIVFDERKDRNAVSWTYLVVGLAANGLGYEAIEIFKEMEIKG